MEEKFIEAPPQEEPTEPPIFPQNTFSHIRNKTRRRELYRQFKLDVAKSKKLEKLRKKKEKEELGDKAPPKQVPKTIESMRVFEETMVDPGDREVQHDEDHDEMAPYFKREVAPKVLITHSNRTVWRIRKFLRELRSTIPSSKVFRRKNIRLKRVIQQAISKDYTHVIVLHHDKTVPNGLIISQLPNGPTAHFRISNVRIRKEIKRCGLHTYHKPEVVLNNFGTRLGHRVGRLFATMFEQDPEFVGRQVVTFHNQRDYIFFRRHRYVFKKNMRVALQELGPRFTLKLRSLQKGTFDTKYGEYEFVHKRREMDNNRRKFFL
ncbi:ribosome production factor 1-like [Apostichopus japonicus]|uniref:ribosome production factor 1-like n=1 Tax=Stichopus japonicus TaxID=307972 RepID=UPI003AB242DF